MSSEVLPQPPSPTITIFSSFLPGPGAVVCAGVPAVSIFRSRQTWQTWRQRAGNSARLIALRGGATESPAPSCLRLLRQAATQADLQPQFPSC